MVCVLTNHLLVTLDILNIKVSVCGDTDRGYENLKKIEFSQTLTNSRSFVHSWQNQYQQQNRRIKIPHFLSVSLHTEDKKPINLSLSHNNFANKSFKHKPIIGCCIPK